MTITRKNALAGLLFVSPFIIGFIVFFLIPLCQSVSFMFYHVKFKDAGGLQMDWTGLENLRYIFLEDPDFNKSLVESLTQMVTQVPVVLVASIFLAIIINQRFIGRTFARAVFFLPVIITSGVVMSVIKGDVFATSLITSSEGMKSNVSATTFGLQELLVNTGLNSGMVEFFTDISGNLFDLLWRTGIQMIIFLAGLQSIPPTLYEASSIEGASAWENFWMITFPMLIPMLMVNLVYTVIDTFTDSTNSIMRLITEQGRSHNFARASTMSWIYFLIIGVLLGMIALVYYRATKQKKAGR